MNDALADLRFIRDLSGPDVGAAQKLVLVSILMLAEGDDRCDPFIDQIVEVSSLGRATVFRALRELEARQLVRRTFRGHHRSSVYELTLRRRSS